MSSGHSRKAAAAGAHLLDRGNILLPLSTMARGVLLLAYMCV